MSFAENPAIARNLPSGVLQVCIEAKCLIWW